ncbi:MAG TPA: PAS domain S-box protein, partial [Blastocatellia bacterium]|nr:PAS domain S-box protein [Blastocatellia bacterium]
MTQDASETNLAGEKAAEGSAAPPQDAGLGRHWPAAILDSAADAIIGETLDGTITSWNQGAERLFGYAAQEVIGRAFLLLVPPQHQGEELEILARVRRGERVEHYEAVRLSSDGRTVVVSQSASPIKDAGGNVIGVAKVAHDVSVRSEAERQLREREKRARLAVKAARLGLWSYDIKTGLVYLDEQMRAIFGEPPDAETLPLTVMLERVHPEDRERVVGVVRAALDPRSSGDYELDHRVVLPDGTQRWVAANGQVLFTGEGDLRKPVECIGTTRDITERKQAEVRVALLADLSELTRKIENPGELLFAITQAVGEHLQVRRCLFNEIDLEHDRETVHRDYCRGVESVAGVHPVSDYSPVTTADMQAGETVVNRDSRTDPRTAALYDQVYALNGERAYVAVPLMREGRWAASLWVSDDRPRNWSEQEVALLEAVAERTWLAVERLRSEQALRESQAHLQLTTEAAQVGTWQWNVGTGELVWSEIHKRLWGYEPTRERVSYDDWARLLDEEDLKHFEQAIEKCLRGPEDYDVEYRIWPLGAAGMRWIRSMGQARFNEEGQVISLQGLSLDITERRQTEEALKEADRRKDEFLAMLAHELRNPLAPIRNAAQVLKLIGPADANQQWAREIIERQTQHLTRLVDDLLDVSRITQGKITLAREPLDLAAIIYSAVETSRPMIGSRRHQLTVVVPSQPLRVEGDSTRLVQVIGNLLNNAAKYTDEGGHIRVEAAREGQEAVIRVRDNGMGLPADLLPHVFDLFTQADRSLDRSQGGLGIGLTLVRQLAELHGGRVEARSDGPAKGSEFVVHLPLSTAAGVERAEASASESAPPTSSPLKILVVEDNLDSAEMLAFMLTLRGHQVHVAHNGAEALEAAHTFTPQAVLCDIGLPGMNGYEVAARLRQQAEFKRTALIALTGYGQEEDRRRAREAGFDYHLTK